MKLPLKLDINNPARVIDADGIPVCDCSRRGDTHGGGPGHDTAQAVLLRLNAHDVILSALRAVAECEVATLPPRLRAMLNEAVREAEE